MDDFSLSCCEELNSVSQSDQSLNEPSSFSRVNSSPVVTGTTKPTRELAGEREVISAGFDENKWATKRTIEPSLVEFFRKKSFQWADCSMNLVDSHCHFDLLFGKLVNSKYSNYYYFF